MFASTRAALETINVNATRAIIPSTTSGAYRSATIPRAATTWRAWRPTAAYASPVTRKSVTHASPFARSQPTTSSASMRNASRRVCASVMTVIAIFRVSSASLSAMAA